MQYKVWSTSFLSTPSARRATPCPRFFVAIPIYFYPRPPRGGRPGAVLRSLPASVYFYPRPPRGGRRGAERWRRGSSGISIHALREEGDRRPPFLRVLRGYFYPRPPRGGRRVPLGELPLDHPISIHALREEGDQRVLRYALYSELFLSTPSARRATAARALSLTS